MTGAHLSWIKLLGLSGHDLLFLLLPGPTKCAKSLGPTNDSNQSSTTPDPCVYYHHLIYITPLLHIDLLLNPRELMIRGVGPLQPVCKKALVAKSVVCELPNRPWSLSRITWMGQVSQVSPCIREPRSQGVLPSEIRQLVAWILQWDSWLVLQTSLVQHVHLPGSLTLSHSPCVYAFNGYGSGLQSTPPGSVV